LTARNWTLTSCRTWAVTDSCGVSEKSKEKKARYRQVCNKWYRFRWNRSMNMYILFGKSLLQIAPSIPSIFLKLHNYHTLPIPYEVYQFSCDRSFKKCILFRKNYYVIRCISPSIQWIFLILHNYHSLPIAYNLWKFGCERSITKGTLFEITLAKTPLNLAFYFIDFSESP